MSVKKEIYIAVRDKILAETNVKTSRLFNSQFENMEGEASFTFPAAFIEFAAIPYVTNAEGGQEAEAMLRIHLGYDSLKTESLEVLDLMEAVHVALQRFTPVSDSSRLNRVFEGQDINHDAIAVWLMEYEFTFTDNSGHRNNKLIETTIGELEVLKDAKKPRLGIL
jgi:hypothetical protein